MEKIKDVVRSAKVEQELNGKSNMVDNIYNPGKVVILLSH